MMNRTVNRLRWLTGMIGLFTLCFVTLCFAPLLGAQELVVYSGRGEKFTRPVLKAFQAETGIKVQSLVSGSGQLLARIREEGPRTPADIFMSNYAGTLERARTLGLLQSYRSPELASIPEAYVGTDAQWFGVSARARAVVYNKKLVKPEQVGSLLDLSRPEWKGRLGITVSTNGSFIGGLATMLQQHGKTAVRNFLVGIKANAGNNVFPKHTPIVSAVARGELALGLVNHYYFYRAIAKNPAAEIGIVFPDAEGVGAPTTISGVALLRYAKHPEPGRKFVDFVLSPRGQRIFAEVNYEFPVRPGVPFHRLLPAPNTIRLAPVSQALKAEKIDEAVELIKTVGMQ